MTTTGPNRAVSVLCTDTAWADYGARLREVAPGIDPILLLDGADHIATNDLERVEVAWFSADTYPGRARPFIGAALGATNLRWLHTFSAGTDSPVFHRFLESGVRLSNSSGSSAEPIAQTVVMLMLALSRDLPRWTRAQAAHRWEPRTWHELTGTTLGVVGMGPIGLAVARLGAALGMTVIGCRRTPRGDEGCEVWALDRVNDLAATVDWLVLALPLTPDTRHIVDGAVLAAMKPTSRLINVGRGELVDEGALVDALQRGLIAGAGLDVFAVEPLPDDSPLWDRDDVIITPHSSGATSGSHHRSALRFVDNLRHYLAGEPMTGEIILGR